MALDKGLFNRYEQCLQDEPAATTAQCPVHVNVPAFCAAMAAGNFQEAYAELQKRIPFAGIFCMVCDHPCQQACVRNPLDGAVNIGQLERAAVTYGYMPLKKKFKTSKKAGQVAVVGGGVSGLSAAYDLDRRGFAVTIYEQSNRLGGWLWQLAGSNLSDTDIYRSLAELEELAITIHLNEHISPMRLQQLLEQNVAVYLGTGSWEEPLVVDPASFQVSGSKLFAGGMLSSSGDSLIAAVSSGKRAAVTMERFAKAVSLTAEREREGTFVTKLPYDSSDAVVTQPISPAGPVYSKTEAMAEAARCLRCECDACLKACAHMQRYGRRPKTYAREIYTNENVFLGTRYANKMINSCTLCGLCAQRCPLHLSMAELVAQTRRSMVANQKMPPSAHDFALRDMAFANSPACALLDVPEQAEYLFFPGCQLAAIQPEQIQAAYAWLCETFPGKVGLQLGCCGAPADWAGRDDLFEANIAALKQAWRDAGNPVIINTCSSCKDVFASKLPEAQTVSLWEIIAKHGLPAKPDELEGLPQRGQLEQRELPVLSVRDACSARNDSAVHDSIRALATALGYELEELRYSRENAKCCGFGGLVLYANREQEVDFATNGAQETGNDILVYCAMCKNLYREQGKRCFHILDLLFDSNLQEHAQRPMPNLSERRENRILLKQQMLASLSGAPLQPLPEALPGYLLVFAPGVEMNMEQRLILLGDIQDALAHALANPDTCFVHPETGHSLVHLRKQFVSYWVEFCVNGKEIIVQRAYSHRMDVAS